MNTLNELKKLSFLVYGLGLTGKSVVNFFKKNKINKYKVWDDDNKNLYKNKRAKNLNKALGMLEEANELKKDDGYITDSLGWALYKLNRYSEAKEYLRAAIILMPSDPIVNDHFADCLWKNNQKIQARYYWNYVLKLKNTDSDLKKIIENKLIFGLEKS